MSRVDFTYYLNGVIPLTVEVDVGHGDAVGIVSVSDAAGNEFDDLTKIGEYVRRPGSKDLGRWVSLEELIQDEITTRARAWQAELRRRDENLFAEARAR